ncbi:MAG: HAD family hydrolase [Candidatus Heimdallarchaeota archaeon]
MIELMIFDAGDVVVLRNEKAFVWAFEQLRNAGWEGDIEQFITISHEIAGELSKGRSDKTIQSILRQKKVPDILDYRALEVRAYWDNPHPEMKEVFSSLKDQGLKLGILTDSVLQEEEVKAQLKRHGLLQYLDAVVTSATTHHVKPEPEAYLEILRRLEAKPRKSTAFIGHAEDELTGARKVGMLTIEYSAVPSGIADYHVSKLLDLVTLSQEI